DREGGVSVASGDRSVMRAEGQPVALASEDASILCLAQAGGALCDSVEHRLDVCRGLTDHTQDLRRPRLLLQRLRKFAPESFGFLSTARLSTSTLSAGKTLAKPFDFFDYLGLRQPACRSRAV